MTHRELVKQIKTHMKSEIIATFLDSDDDDVKPIRDPIVEALIFIDDKEEKLDEAACAMIYRYEQDGELEELQTAEADWYREFLCEAIPHKDILQYISNLNKNQ